MSLLASLSSSRRSAERQYVAIIRRHARPQPSDAEALKECMAALDLTLADVSRDASIIDQAARLEHRVMIGRRPPIAPTVADVDAASQQTRNILKAVVDRVPVEYLVNVSQGLIRAHVGMFSPNQAGAFEAAVHPHLMKITTVRQLQNEGERDASAAERELAALKQKNARLWAAAGDEQ
jgi:hypothetical protein